MSPASFRKTTPPPKLDERAQAEFIKKAQELAPKHRTELLKPYRLTSPTVYLVW